MCETPPCLKVNYTPFQNYIKKFKWVWSRFEVPKLQVYCEVNCIAAQLPNLLSSFGWMSIQWNQISLDLCRHATKALLLFPTAYLCEAGFSTLALFETKCQNQPQPEDYIRCALMTTCRYFDKLVERIQRRNFHKNLWMWAINQIF